MGYNPARRAMAPVSNACEPSRGRVPVNGRLQHGPFELRTQDCAIKKGPSLANGC